MTDRLKNTIICSLLLMGKYIMIILAAELIMAAVMFMQKDEENFNFMIGSDLLPMLVTMLSGMSFFERHNAFCTANAVSRKNRIISIGMVSVVISLFVSVIGCIAVGIIADAWISLGELVRTTAHTQMISGGNIPADIAEMFFFSETVFFSGYFFGSLRYSKGNAIAMITLAISAAIIFGSIFLSGVMNFTPAMILLYIPALMQRSVFTAVILNIILAAAFLWCSVKLSEVTVEKRREG